MSGRNLNGHFLAAAALHMERNLNPEQREAVRQKLSTESEKALLSASPKDWHPAEQVNEVFEALWTSYPDPDAARAGFTAMGRIIASEAANTFMRLFMKIVTPAMLLKQFPKVWPKYANFGDFELGAVKSDLFSFTIRDMKPMKYEPYVSVGWTINMLEAMNRKNIQVTAIPESGILGEDGNWDMTISARWS